MFKKGQNKTINATPKIDERAYRWIEY